MPMYPIVGERHYPPAKAILQTLPIGTKLSLVPYPSNPVDPNAIMVWVDSEDIRSSADLDQFASGFGHDSASIKSQTSWHLGYIAAPVAKTLFPFSACTATFALSSSGSFMALVE